MRLVKGGMVTLSTNPNATATVVQIEFATVAAGAVVVPDGSIGTMILKDPPKNVGRFDAKNVLQYSDGNNNNHATLTVVSNIGPSKYTVRKG